MSITIRKINTAIRAGKRSRLQDGNGLNLAVSAKGTASWTVRYTPLGRGDGDRRQSLGLGRYPNVTIARAREKAIDIHRAVAEGIDPKAERDREPAPTFRVALESVIEQKRTGWKGEGTERSWRATLERHAADIMDTPVDAITRQDALSILTPIWVSKPEMARRVRRRIRAVLTWAQAFGHVTINCAGETVDGALAPQPSVRRHHPALPHSEVAEAISRVDASTAGENVKLAFRFMVLTAARSGEVRGADWSEIDFATRLWTIPGERMKAGKTHRVPLSAAALDVLKKARDLEAGSGLIFPASRLSRTRGKPMSDMTLSKRLKDESIAAVPHGFRASFKTWAQEETEADFTVSEMCLAHYPGNLTERAYARSDLITKRRALLNEWAEYLDLQSASTSESEELAEVRAIRG